MKQENDYTRDVVKALRQRLPTSVTFRFSDLFTMGVPDFSVTRGGVTSWYEAKLLDEPKNWEYSVAAAGKPDTIRLRPAVDVPAVQWETLRRLIRGYLVVYTPFGHALTRVTGLRESVGTMQLKMKPLKTLVDEIIKSAENGKETEW